MTAALIVHQAYDIHLPLAGLLHPFDGRRPSRALSLLRASCDAELDSCLRQPDGPATDVTLALVHDAAYLASLRRSAAIATALEIRLARFAPASVLHRRIVDPMRWMVAGTITAARHALDHGVAMNLGGGFHHAHADHGEGFCLFADVPIAIRLLIADGRLGAHDTVLVIDLDAHRGNGFESICSAWPVQFFDLYNFQAYPGLDDRHEDRFPFLIPLKAATGDAAYLDTLTSELPRFLDRFAPARLAFYIAGSDVVISDPLGGLALSEGAIGERDRFVIASLRDRGIPLAVVCGGGYTARSAQMVADTARLVLATR